MSQDLHNSEQVLLQLFLQQPALTIDAASRGLKKKHFRDKNYGKAYDSILRLYVNCQSIPTSEELETFDIKREDIKIEQTFEHLLKNIQDKYNASYFKDTIINGVQQIALAQEEKEEISINEVSENLKAQLSNLVNFSLTQKYATSEDISEQFLDSYQDKVKWKLEGKLGISMGLKDIDEAIGGLQRSWFVIVAARNNVGKSWVACKGALTAINDKKNVLFLSYEMTNEEVWTRLVALESRVEYKKIMRAELDMPQLQTIRKNMEILRDENHGKFYINDSPGSIANIKSIVNDINQKNPGNTIDVIYIDGIYNMKIEGSNKTEEYVKHTRIAELSKELAKELVIPIVGTHQMTREYGRANDKKTGDTIEAGDYGLSGADAYTYHADVIIIMNQREQVWKSLNYLQMKLQKNRHGEKDIYFYIKMKLDVPEIYMVDYNDAKTEIEILLAEKAPKNTVKANKLMDAASEVFEKNNQQFHKVPEVKF